MMEILTVEEVANRLKVKIETVQGWLRTGQLNGIKLNRLWRIREQDLNDFINGKAS